MMAVVAFAGLGHVSQGGAVPLNADVSTVGPRPLQTGNVNPVNEDVVFQEVKGPGVEVDRPVTGSFGAEPAPNAKLEKLLRASSRRMAAERGETVRRRPQRIARTMPRNRPRSDIGASAGEKAQNVTPAAPVDATRSMRRSSRGYAYHVARGATFGASMAEGVSVVHVVDFAADDAPPAGGRLVVYPRPSPLQPLPPIDPLQTAFDLSDPSPVARNAYELPVAVLDNVDIIPRVGRFREESPFPPCCGPTQLQLIHDPRLGLIITPHPRAFKPGQTFQFVPLTASVW